MALDVTSNGRYSLVPHSIWCPVLALFATAGTMVASFEMTVAPAFVLFEAGHSCGRDQEIFLNSVLEVFHSKNIFKL